MYDERLKAIQKSVIGRALSLEGKEKLKFLSLIKPEYFDSGREQDILTELIKNPDHTEDTLAETMSMSEEEVQETQMYLESLKLRNEPVERHIEVLKESYVKAGLSVLSNMINTSLEKHPSKNILWAIERQVNWLSRETSSETGSLLDAADQLDKLKKDDVIIYTGINGLDKITGGLRRGRVWVVGGNSGSGKSFLALNFVFEQLIEGRNILFFSTELTKEENLRRLVCLYQQKFGEPDFERCKAEVVQFSNLKIYSEHTTTEAILFEIKRQKVIMGVDLVVIDHLQDIEVIGTDKEYDSIRRTCLAVKDIALRLNVACILISQMNRASIATKHSGDVMGFLGSGKIEQIAHVAILLNREEDLTQLIVKKNRSGGTGIVNTQVIFPGGRFVEVIGERVVPKKPDPYSSFRDKSGKINYEEIQNY